MTVGFILIFCSDSVKTYLFQDDKDNCNTVDF